MIELKDVTKKYVNGEVVTPVLHGVTLDIEEGEFVALMGPSGSGKSTIMHILGFLDRLTSGSYRFKGKDVSELGDNELAYLRRDEVGFVFQFFNLISNTTVLENTMLPMLYAEVPRPERIARAKKALENVGLGHRTEHIANQISGGERQRVAIARALVNNPSIIFADEPTGNLDTQSGLEILQIFQNLNEAGHTVIMVTHEQEAAEFAKRIVRVRDGNIVSDEAVSRRRTHKFAK
ncbi:MAG: ABC transporter ATP-binding protein [Candidatus Uhrbacteria bacterium]|nr:ABC transporter ATP-binding protein [Candidatus Uhrbacteria bacterium]